MKASFRKSFTRDLKKLKDRPVLERVRQAIEQVEAAATLQEVSDFKKMGGTSNDYRIRMGDYRIGVVVEGDTVEFVRCLPRRDLYRFSREIPASSPNNRFQSIRWRGNRPRSGIKPWSSQMDT